MFGMLWLEFWDELTSDSAMANRADWPPRVFPVRERWPRGRYRTRLRQLTGLGGIDA